MSLKLLVVALMLLALPLAFADVGPGPAAPTVTVHLVRNNASFTGISTITYHCMDSTGWNASSPVQPVPVNLSCSAGTCTNDAGWYYKFNPCFSFPEGYFSYGIGGSEKRTDEFNVYDSSGSYDLTIDVDSGAITSGKGPPSPGCLPATAILAVLAAALLARRG